MRDGRGGRHRERALGPDLKNKWQGAVLAPDGAFYAVPADAASVLKIVPETGE